MIELDYRLSRSWKKIDAPGVDLEHATWSFLFLTAFSADQVMIVNGFNCSLFEVDVPILFFASTLYREVLALEDGSRCEMPYLLDEDINLYFARRGAVVKVESSVIDGHGQCDYQELADSTSAYAKRVLMDCITTFPELSRNAVLRERYPVMELGLESVFRT